MEPEVLLEERSTIIRLEDEVQRLQEKEEELRTKKKDYFEHYFALPREEYALLTAIPEHITLEQHPLWNSSVLNVDIVGECIKELFSRYEGKEVGIRRTSRKEFGYNAFGNFYVDVPILEIYPKERTKKDSIKIEFDRNATLEEYPTKRPVFWHKSGRKVGERASNYRHLLGYYDDLIFDDQNHEFIKELIFSLAYYQQTHEQPFMSEEETIKVFQKIYR